MIFSVQNSEFQNYVYRCLRESALHPGYWSAYQQEECPQLSPMRAHNDIFLVVRHALAPGDNEIFNPSGLFGQHSLYFVR